MPKIEAIIRSMTLAERNDPSLINGGRRKRIAAGSGSTIQDVNRLVKQFDQVRKLMKQMSGGKGRMPFGNMKLPPGLGL
jgi:signal recognition particle subunit SRP54